MIVLGVLIAHLIGDYVLQNSWMAKAKLESSLIALFHGWIQGSLLFIVLLFMTDLNAYVIFWIFGVTWITHALIDHWRLVKPIIWALNQIGPRGTQYSWLDAKRNNGYSPETPAWMSTWLMIIFDNTLHLAITFVLLLIVL